MKKIIIEKEMSSIHLDTISNDSDCVIIVKQNNITVGAIFREPGNTKWMIRVSNSINTDYKTLKEVIENFSEYEYYVLD